MTGLNLREHLERDVLAWWVREGVDAERGGVRTCFTNRGEPISTEKYTWSQGRWAWTCALAADEVRAGRLSGEASEWVQRSTATARFLADHAILPDDRTSFRLSAKGTMLADESGEKATSVFADLFAVLGLAGAARVASEARSAEWLAQAHRTLLGAETSIADGTAASAPYPVPRGFRDLAGPMTLLHTAAELHRSSGSQASLDVAVRARAVLLGSHDSLLGPDTWWEFRPDAQADADTLLARHVTPGHLLELLWMFVHLGDLVPELAVSDVELSELAQRALKLGWDDAEGGLLRYVDRIDGDEPRGRLLDTPYEDLVVRTWDTKLWWVHAETMYTVELLSRRTGSPELAAWSQRVRDYTLATFPDTSGREWIQIRSRDGEPLDEVVALPVKDPLHIARSLLLLNALPDHTTDLEDISS